MDRETQLGLWIPRKTSINDLSPSEWGRYNIVKLYKIKMGDFNVKNKRNLKKIKDTTHIIRRLRRTPKPRLGIQKLDKKR